MKRRIILAVLLLCISTVFVGGSIKSVAKTYDFQTILKWRGSSIWFADEGNGEDGKLYYGKIRKARISASTKYYKMIGYDKKKRSTKGKALRYVRKTNGWYGYILVVKNGIVKKLYYGRDRFYG